MPQKAPSANARPTIRNPSSLPPSCGVNAALHRAKRVSPRSAAFMPQKARLPTSVLPSESFLPFHPAAA